MKRAYAIIRNAHRPYQTFGGRKKVNECIGYVDSWHPTQASARAELERRQRLARRANGAVTLDLTPIRVDWHDADSDPDNARARGRAL